MAGPWQDTEFGEFAQSWRKRVRWKPSRPSHPRRWCWRGRLVAYQDARAAGELRHRVYAMVRGPYEQLRDAGVYTGFGDEWVRIGGVKYGADGSASERTMRMSTPFEGRPDDYGILTMSQEEIHEVVEDAHRHSWQVGIHANGDVTIDMVLNAYERVLARWPHPDCAFR